MTCRCSRLAPFTASTGILSIESREYAAALHGKAEQIHIGQLLMADDPLGVEEPVIDQADLIGPERVTTAGGERSQSFDELSDTGRRVCLRQRRRGPQKAVLGQRTRGPSARSEIGEPIVGGVVVNVCGLEEREQHVDVEQRHR